MLTSNPDREAARSRLIARRREILARYRTQLALAEEELAPEIEAVDTATAQWDASVLASLAEHERHTVEQIALALARLDAGAYGVCAICRTAIGQARLEALPEALICVECAEAREPFEA